MKHFASSRFWSCYERLPENVRKQADRSFELLKTNLQHPSLHFKKIRQYRSARVGLAYRALAVELDDDLLWFWIGTHTEYDSLID